jgi:hypothetical protein
MLGRGFGLGLEQVRLPEQDLALEVGDFHQIAVDEGQLPDTGPGQPGSNDRTGGAQAHHRDPARAQPVVCLSAEDDALLSVAINHVLIISIGLHLCNPCV